MTKLRLTRHLSPFHVLATTVVLLAAIAGGCGGPNDLELTEVAQPIVNGVATEGDAAVIGLVRDQEIVCTASMVSRRVAVTAAHCLDRVASPSETFFGSHPDQGGVRIPLLSARPHPAFDPATFANDVGVVVLAADAPAAPVEMLPSDRVTAALSLAGRIRLVGFGETGTAAPLAKRTGAATITVVTPSSFTLRPDPAQPCTRDSGGPALVMLDREYLAGVVSHGDVACRTGGVQTRVDAYRDGFIAAEIQAAERDAAAGCRVAGSRRAGAGAVPWAAAMLALAVRRSRRRSAVCYAGKTP